MTVVEDRVATPIGVLSVKVSEAGLHSISLVSEESALECAPPEHRDTFEQIRKSLGQYFKSGAPVTLSLPLVEEGTDFQRAVWKALRDIPFGTTTTYGAIARALGRPNGSRAVGQACGKNPILIFTPCHRVLASDGSLGGFACGLEAKTALLKVEGAVK